MKSVKFWVMHKLVWLALKGRLYFIWSKIYRFIFERKYSHTVLPKVDSIKSLSTILCGMQWRADSWWMLGDAISTPKAMYNRYIHNEPVEDCDGFAIFAVDRIQDMLSRGVESNIIHPHFLTCTWIDDKNKVGGHNVCIYTYLTKMGGNFDKVRYAYIGNWSKGIPISGFRKRQDVVEDILRRRKAKLLGWSLTDANLKLIKYSDQTD